jgi:DNA helicase-2/ATP-dependent DNA helicase PcrA
LAHVTLAHRVAHLIVRGADPRRILLMTFSRRAASEMTKRVERIARKVMGDNAGIMTDALTWAGTYHSIGARLLREYAEQIGLETSRCPRRGRGARSAARRVVLQPDSKLE